VPDRTAGTSDPALSAAVAAAAHGVSPDDTLVELLAIAAGMLGARMGAAFLWDAERGALALAGSFGVPEGTAERFEAAVADPANPVARAAHDRVRVLDAPMAFPEGETIVATWPVVVTGEGMDEPIGAVAFGRAAPWAIDPTDADRVAAVADLVGLVVDRARTSSMLAERSEWLERVSHSDALTGLANARTAQRVLELELVRAARQGSEVSVAIFDVDAFGSINDAAGRSAGDDVLREVAAVLADSVRLVDTVARWGGDEFLLVAPGSGGAVVANRIMEAAGRLAVPDATVTLSVGLARFPANGTSGDDLIAAAEAALADAKAGGAASIGEAPAPVA
jgi:diguanylate cyclase (GGDEF)-like protein